MQNLPISNPAPITASVPASSPSQPQADSNAEPISEPFGSVLARQRAQDGSSQPATKSPSAVNGQAANQPDMAGTLPADMLAALLPAQPAGKPGADLAASVAEKPGAAVDEKKSGASNEKPDAPAADGSAALPGDMLAALVTPPIGMQLASAAAQPQPNAAGRVLAAAVPDTGSAPGDAGALGNARQAAAGSQAALLQLRAQGNPKAEPAVTDRPQANPKSEPAVAASPQPTVFSAALETLGRNAAATAQLGSDGRKLSVQAAPPDAPTNMPNLLQSNAAPLVVSQHAPVQATVNTPVANERWGDEFSQKVTWLSTQQGQSAELHLNPPHLGPLDVVLSVSGDQATALFTSAHAAVREAVEQALPKLREMLAGNGIMLGNATVSDQSPGDRQTAEQQTADRQRRNEGGLSAMNAAGAISSGGLSAPVRRHQGMLDTFA